MAEPGQIRNPHAIPGLYRRAVLDAFAKLDPRSMIRNPVMFTVEIGSVITTILWLQALGGSCRFHRCYLGMALVHGALCQFCRGACRRPGQSAG
jgi:high-affinity K+ transport system ATPase subunit B